MSHAMRKTQLRLLALLIALVAAFGVVSVVQSAPAQAAQGMTLDCSIRSTTQAYVLANGSYRNVGCGGTYSTTAANGITRVVVDNLPYCVYFGSTLAGCGSPGQSRDVSNRSGQTGRIVPQNPASR